jgi:molybdopterin converting factor small subunit
MAPSSKPRVEVALPASLTAPAAAGEVRCEAATVRGLLDAVAVTRPALAGRLLFEGRPLVSIILNDVFLAPRAAMATKLADGDRVELLPPVAGG